MMVHDVNSVDGALSPTATMSARVGQDEEGSLPAGFQRECLSVSGEIVVQLLAIGERLRQIVAGVAASFAFTPQQALLIERLGVPRTMGQIAEVLSCDKSNVTGLISRLEARGLVARTADGQDRRIKWLVLTDEGRAIRQEVRDAIVAHGESLLVDTSPRERELFLDFLRQASERIAAPAAGGACAAAAGMADAPHPAMVSDPADQDATLSGAAACPAHPVGH